MENASKALLIAAAVLIAIILVTISIKILSPTTSVVEDSEKIGSAISSSSKDAVANFENSMGGGKWTQNGTVVKKGSLTLEVGDYINYDAGVSGYTGKWRILGVENGQLLILSDTIEIKKFGATYKLSGLDGYKQFIDTMNNSCIDYSQGRGGVSARALKLEDINKITGYNPTQYNKDKIDEYGNEVTYQLSSDRNEIYYSATNGLNGSRKIDNDFINIDGTKLTPDNSITVKSTYFRYNIGEFLEQGTKVYEMLCRSSYALATTSITTGLSNVSYSGRAVSKGGSIEGYSLYNTSNNGGTFISIKPRAVVYLKPDIQLQKNGNTWQIL